MFVCIHIYIYSHNIYSKIKTPSLNCLLRSPICKRQFADLNKSSLDF